jgi:hypothetical protein
MPPVPPPPSWLSSGGSKTLQVTAVALHSATIATTPLALGIRIDEALESKIWAMVYSLARSSATWSHRRTPSLALSNPNGTELSIHRSCTLRAWFSLRWRVAAAAASSGRAVDFADRPGVGKRAKYPHETQLDSR